MNQQSLYERIGSYDGIAAFVNELLSRLQADKQLARFWQNRGEDGIAREKKLTIDYLCSGTGGPMNYTGRDMIRAHKGMKISNDDWSLFLQHTNATMAALQLPKQECDELVALVLSLSNDIVEA